jgi:hypothetical protein
MLRTVVVLGRQQESLSGPPQKAKGDRLCQRPPVQKTKKEAKKIKDQPEKFARFRRFH